MKKIGIADTCFARYNMGKAAIDQLPNLKNTEVHSTVLLSQVDENTFRKLGANLTCDPVYQSKKLYHKGVR